MKTTSLPPGPKNPLVIGHLRAFRRNPLHFLERVAKEFGDLTYFRLANQNIYFLNHPDLIKEVLVTQQAHFRKSRVLQRARILLGDGLLTSEGELHLRQRRLVQPAFHRDRLAGYARSMTELAERASVPWRSGEVRDMHEEMTRLTLAVVAKTLFQADVEGEAKAIGEAMNQVLGLLGVAMLPFSELMLRLPFPQTKRFLKAKGQLDGTIARIIEERRKSGVDAGDLLSMLILATDEDAGSGSMNDQQVRDEAMTLFLAGHETTANAMTWAWYLLSENPEAEAKFHEEVDRVGAASFENLEQFRYTRAVFAEAMRLYPPAWGIGRMALRDVELGGYSIHRGDIVLMSPYVMHRAERFWPDAGKFRPERFLDGEENRLKFSYFPFGGGTRVCIGERFAWMEGTLLLAAIGKRWWFRLVPEQVVDTHPQITLRPRYGMRMLLKSR